MYNSKLNRHLPLCRFFFVRNVFRLCLWFGYLQQLPHERSRLYRKIVRPWPLFYKQSELFHPLPEKQIIKKCLKLWNDCNNMRDNNWPANVYHSSSMSSRKVKQPHINQKSSQFKLHLIMVLSICFILWSYDKHLLRPSSVYHQSSSMS